MISRETLEHRVREYREMVEQRQATVQRETNNLNAAFGALQLAEQLLVEFDQPEPQEPPEPK